MNQIGQNLIIKKKEYTSGRIDTYIYFDNVIKNYSGSSDVKNEKIKKLNSKYFLENSYECDSNGVKAMSYMLDEDVWRDFKNMNLAEFVVGGPSYESLREAYKALNQNRAPELKVTELGYVEPTTFWLTSSDIPELEFLYTEKDYFLSTSMTFPSANMVENNTEYIMSFGKSTEGMPYDYIIRSEIASRNNGNFGFRPMVCLKSDIKLIEETNGTLSISK